MSFEEIPAEVKFLKFSTFNLNFSTIVICVPCVDGGIAWMLTRNVIMKCVNYNKTFIDPYAGVTHPLIRFLKESTQNGHTETIYEALLSSINKQIITNMELPVYDFRYIFATTRYYILL